MKYNGIYDIGSPRCKRYTGIIAFFPTLVVLKLRTRSRIEAAQHINIAVAMRPLKPEGFDGSRDFLKVNTWIYKMVQFFTLVRHQATQL